MAKLNQKGGIFSSVLKKRQKSSVFNLSHDVKLSLDMGDLVPHYIQECVPGDSVTMRCSSMFRFAPLVAPVMHKVEVKMEYFFVPNRILWNNWETFITGSRNGKQLTAEEMPAFPTLKPNASTLPAQYLGVGSLANYMGIPTEQDFVLDVDRDIEVSALPFAAYQRIYDEYYRDENLQVSLYENEATSAEFVDYNKLPDGPLSDNMSALMVANRYRAWEHDYFTSALPWAQKGEAVQIPVDFDTSGLSLEFDDAVSTRFVGYNGEGFAAGEVPSWNSHPDGVYQQATSQSDPNLDETVRVDNSANLNIVSGSTTGSGGTINDLRAAFKLQEWLETNARGGTRYFESIYAHFGITSPDSRLQRPEFIGSTRSNMIISEVLQTSSPQSDTDTPQGNMSGHGQSVNSSKKLRYTCKEHGYIIGMVSIIPKTAYQQGVPKHFLKTEDRLQYYFPEFAHLGEQEIDSRELYIGNDRTPDDVFGYTPRYAEYKFMNSRVAGDFRDTLRYWHLGRHFDNQPQLNDQFVTTGVGLSKRIFAVQNLPQDEETEANELRDYHTIYGHIFHDVKARRLMPKYGTPMI